MLEKFMENYKLLIIVPIVIAILSLTCLATIGIDEGVDLKGGTMAEVTLNHQMSNDQITSQLQSALHVNEVKIISNSNNKATIELSDKVDVGQFKQALNGMGTVTSYNTVGPVLSQEAMNQVYWALLFAFIFMAITVFFVFREIVPAFAVILSALFDIIYAAGGMALLNVPLSIASVGALLMLIGYSVDTDIMLTTRLLKRKNGTVVERATEAMKTGLTMSIAAIAAMVVLYVVTDIFMPQAKTLSEISMVLILGLVADIINTWFMNLGILRKYIDFKNNRKHNHKRKVGA
ncbi:MULTISPECIES: protein translocase subunit SecF [Methanobrevibacter]|jgi:preprotein translocase subunit SecF|uniref:protein translocase subunit SecF n=1 Tax=Methanobrevibacter TaxID=2172 RepID=UPI00033487ED|nr:MULTISPECIES: protein translocase subunit SecF [Methanobrevibacter]AGN16398.1 protein export membrane protein SecF [Methanobrevibacter sp. AbM4]MCI6775232.1 protein translocase subunit SecF [Methanobrevibacter boviskoreani]MCI6930032.1 protein translocase subunit SecF [Methanobrevibacter boviskoreani]MDD6257456.1 protein translocase subunit SecF [Methanobrevibacter boviskoreani]MDY5614360.1 protein translocase subunit SecF [Methanobrevibacter boviskoreani]